MKKQNLIILSLLDIFLYTGRKWRWSFWGLTMFWCYRISKIWSYFAILCILDTLLTVERNGDEFLGVNYPQTKLLSWFQWKIWSYFAILCILDTLLTVERNGDEFFWEWTIPKLLLFWFQWKIGSYFAILCILDT